MAVYTQVTQADLEEFLQGYDLGSYLAHEGIAQGVSNSNFHLFTDKGRYILTLFEKRRVNYDDLPFFFAYSGHMADKGIVCPHALPDRGGNVVGTLAGRAVAVLEFLEGVDVKPGDLTPDHLVQVGEVTARMHVAAQDFEPQRENTMGIAHWHRLVDKAADYADEFSPGLYAELQAELTYLKENWPSGLPRGAVHADIFPDNVFFTDGKLSAVIDFYFSCTDFYAFDLAVTVNAWCFNKEDRFSPERCRAFMAGYQAVRPLPDEEKEALQILHRGSAFRTLISRLEEFHEHDPENTMMVPHDPAAYLKRLYFHQEFDIASFA
ncbi:MAG: homoserine kinase [Rhodospirillales bacterium]|nr:homoserine kinase [Rhodospirillales bacterium]MCB9995277.1 homoserine kinase [Rhodospirillales bacterium]